MIRYGPQYQLPIPPSKGHVSAGIELVANVAGIASRIADSLGAEVP